MNPALYRSAGTALAIVLSLTTAGCASNGKFASKANGPVDPTVTFKNVCNGTRIADGLFQSAVTASGGVGNKISAEDVRIEKDAYTAISAICSGPVPSDLTTAILAITADAIPIGQLVQKYTGKTVAISVPPG